MTAPVDCFRALRSLSEEEFFALPNLDMLAVTINGQTLLHEAISLKKFDIAKRLIFTNIDIDAVDVQGKTALHYTAIYDALEVAKLILEKGGNPNLLDRYGNSALWAAAVNPKTNYSLVKLFVEHGADIYHKNNVGRTVLDVAMQIKDKELLAACGVACDEEQ